MNSAYLEVRASCRSWCVSGTTGRSCEMDVGRRRYMAAVMGTAVRFELPLLVDGATGENGLAAAVKRLHVAPRARARAANGVVYDGGANNSCARIAGGTVAERSSCSTTGSLGWRCTTLSTGHCA